MKTHALLIGAVVLCWAMHAQAVTITYNAANDFSINNGNPNGVWSYGRETGSTAFVALGTGRTWVGRNEGGHDYSGIESWDDGAAYDDSVNHNASSAAIDAYGFTWAPNALTLDSFSGSEAAGWPTVRWTAPATGLVDITGTFTNVSNSGGNSVDIHYFRNGVYGGYLGNSSPAGLAYLSKGVSFTAGDTFDFVAANGGVTKVDLSFSQSVQAAISIQFTNGSNALASTETAGVVPVEHWNIVGANASGQSLSNSTNGVSGVTVSTPALTYSQAPNAPTFASSSDNKLMTTTLFRPNVSGSLITIGGTIPYAKYDVYAYFNASDVNNNQAFTLGSDALVRTGTDVAGADTAYSLSSSNTTGNYVKFGSLTNATLPNFVLNSTADIYNYINGIQIVDRTNTWTAGWDLLRNEIPGGSESNPNGAWSYGTSSSLGGTFAAYSSGQHTDDAFGQGQGIQGYNAGVPFTTVNTADAHNLAYPTMLTQTAPGEMWIQGPVSGDGQNIIRWTSPINGAISIDANFVKQQTLEPVWTVLHNGVALYSSSGTGNYTTDFLSVSIGDTIDFALASSGSNSDGAMGFDAFIAQVPEPGAFVVLATGLVGLLCYAWRKRR